MLHRDYDFRHAFLYDPNPFPWNVTGCHWVTSYFSSQVRWFGETNRCFSTIPKCQDTKRAIGIYEALNDKKGEAGYLQVLHVSGVGFGGSLHTVFFGSPSIGKRRFFPAWKPRNPVKGKGSERSYSYFYQLLRLMKRQKLLLTSLGSCFFTGKKRHQFLWRNLVVWNEKTCIFFFNIGSKHVLVSLFVLGHWLSIDPPTFFLCSPQKNIHRWIFPKLGKCQGLAWINHCSGLTKMGDFQEVCWPRVVVSYSGGASCSCIFGNVDPRFCLRQIQKTCGWWKKCYFTWDV